MKPHHQFTILGVGETMENNLHASSSSNRGALETTKKYNCNQWLTRNNNLQETIELVKDF